MHAREEVVPPRSAGGSGMPKALLGCLGGAAGLSACPHPPEGLGAMTDEDQLRGSQAPLPVGARDPQAGQHSGTCWSWGTV